MESQDMPVCSLTRRWSRWAHTVNAWCVTVALLSAAPAAFADEGGVSFWLPGQLGSFSALPGDPGWSLPLVYYHYSGDAGGSKAFEIGGAVTLGLDAKADLFIAVPTYTFSSPVLGAQASLSVTALAGHVSAKGTATLTGPFGGVLSAATSDSRDGVGDLYPMATLKWNRGAHNFMTYAMAGVPVGTYDVDRLANIGTNHWALDGGGGYTYLDPAKGHEFTAVLGITYNWKNPDTNYRNGVDSHLDWAASQTSWV